MNTAVRLRVPCSGKGGDYSLLRLCHVWRRIFLLRVTELGYWRVSLHRCLKCCSLQMVVLDWKMPEILVMVTINDESLSYIINTFASIKLLWYLDPKM